MRCALMARVPLVVAGPSALDPYDRFATRVLDRAYRVVDACEAAAAAEVVECVRRTEAVVAETLGPDRASATAVSVRRQAGGLRVQVIRPRRRDRRERQTAVVRIVGALRHFDRDARTIDVVVGWKKAGGAAQPR